MTIWLVLASMLVQEKGPPEPIYLVYISGLHCEHCAEEARTALTLPGVKEVEVSVEEGKVTMHPDKSVPVRPGDLQKALPKKFKLVRIEVRNLHVTLVEEKGTIWIQAGYPRAAVVPSESAPAPHKVLLEAVRQGASDFILSGVLSEVREKDKSGKEVVTLRIAASSATPVKRK